MRHETGQAAAVDMRDWTVGELLRRRAQTDGERPFIQTVGGPANSYRQVWDAARRVAGGLHGLGVVKGDTVVVMLRNGMDALHAWFGINLLGAIDVMVNTGYLGATFEHALNQAGARHLVIGAEFLPMLRASQASLPLLETVLVVGPRDPVWQPQRPRLLDFADIAGADAVAELPAVAHSDIASVIYTSGTSGAAKGVLMPHAQVVLLARQTARHCRLGPDDVYYSFHPLYHMAGKFMQVLACAVAGAKLVLDGAFEPAHWLARVRAHGATVSGAHGPMLEMIYAQPPSEVDRAHSLRTICSAPFPRHIARAFEQRFGVRGLEVWGMTEVGIPLWCALDEPLREGACGKLDADWFDFQIVDPATDAPLPPGQTGEFVVRARHPWTLMQGYIGMPAQTVAAWRNLWFHTGDSGYMDEAGYVYFVDRTADRIRRRAENISSYDIEIAALRHPAIALAAAVATPSEFAGDDDIRLCVVCHSEARLEQLDLLRHLAGLLPHYMVPRYIERLDDLPRSATHKVQRAVLKQRPLGPGVWDRKAHGIALRELKEAK